MRLGVVVTSGLVLAAASVVIGVVVSGVMEAPAYCSGSVVDTTLCDSARLRVLIFGSLLAAAGLTAASVVAAAGVVASALRARQPTPEDPDVVTQQGAP